MGCVSSKQKKCNHCNTPYCSVSRSYTMHVHHPPQSKGDSYHLVALTSTTLGSLELVSHSQSNGFVPTSGPLHPDKCNGLEVGTNFMFSNGKVSDSFKEEVENEAKTWSTMIVEKLPKSIVKNQITKPTCELDEKETIINTWELMEGLEETSPLQSPNLLKTLSFDVNVNGNVEPQMTSIMENDDDDDGIDLHKPKLDPMIEEGSNESSLKVKVLDFDDFKVVSSFKDSFQDKQEGMDEKLSFFEEKKINDDVFVDFKVSSHGKKEKVVLYFTSLRMVRKTYEDCCNVKIILKGLGIRVDERDVSMHLEFKEELKELLGEEYGKGGLPKVFIGRKYIGGVEEIQKLHDDKKLEKLLDCCEKIDEIEGGDNGGCEVCGDIKFVPCETCYGSCKIYYEDDCEVGEFGFQRCSYCNENGLIRCSMCCF
ncbi:uncharacterized protein At5g39865 [Lathyrus oleraceus]|uniref:Glutaredoxin domain-containing protein n=2 Tax=Pisum sativum TaxID=3888 RepID=A0A9D5GVW3_PEA|nr:uncharacterized protein At5g39865-like [Pisum sativum]KAI5443044.1 hypothetical protein KIW84_011904 [Pisum sativum]